MIGNFWNGGEFYGTPEYNSLVLLERYFEEYPEDAPKIALSIKGGINPQTGRSVGSPDNTRRTLDDSLAQLKGRKKLDLFEFARRDPNVPFETTFGTMDRSTYKQASLEAYLYLKCAPRPFMKLLKSPRSLPSRSNCRC